MEKQQRVQAAFELVDAQTQCARALCTKLTTSDNPAYNQLLELVVRMLDQFTFEIRSEMYRNGEIELNGVRHKASTGSELTAMQAALDCYENAMNRTAQAHTRAMLDRQYCELQRAFERLVSFHRLASAAHADNDICADIHVLRSPQEYPLNPLQLFPIHEEDE